MIVREQRSLLNPSVGTIRRLRKDFCEQVLGIDFFWKDHPDLLQFMKSEDMGNTSDVSLKFGVLRHEREVIGTSLKQRFDF